MIGQPMEAAMWYKTADQREQAKDYIRAAFARDERECGLLFGPIVFQDADLNTRRAPKPPEEGARLLIGEARIVGVKSTAGEEFRNNLDAKDLALLRRITQQAWLKYPDSKPLSVDELDRMIAITSEDILERMLRWGHEHGLDRTH